MNRKLIIKQNGYKDCGPSCLLSIMRYYGLEASHEEVSYLLKMDKEGTNAYEIINGSKSFGFDGYGIHYTYEEIVNNKISFPIICHVLVNNMYHFIVVYKVKKNKLIIMDPSSQNSKITKEYFKEIYQNTSIVIYPVKEIKKLSNYISLFKLLKEYLSQEKANVIKFVILSILTIVLGIISNYLILIAVDILLPNFDQNVLLKVSIIFTNIFILRNIFNYIKNKILFNIEKNISININNEFIRKYFNLPYQFFKNKSTGETISRLNDLNNFKNFFSQIITNIFTNSLLIFISFIILMNINKKLFIITLIELIIYVLIVILEKDKINKKSEQILISNSDYEKILTESIYGYETNKNLDMINETIKKIEIGYIKNINKTVQYEIILNKQFFLKETITNISYIITTILGVIYINEGVITLGEFMLYNSVISYFSMPIKDILDLEPIILYMKNIYNRINDIIMVRQNDKQEVEKKIKEDIIIKDLTYKRGNKRLFDNVNLKIMYGDKVLIYGNSGIGKSTIMKVIMKYLEEYEGDIYFGNINLKDISSNNIRKNITYVSQNNFINNDTFKNNIIYERNIDESQYEKVLEICNLNKLRDKNKSRNDFMIEEDGFNISGGERQKILLARSILKETNYLVLDEALSEVGVDEEKEIINKLFDYFEDKTIIYISHKKEIIDMFKKKYKIERRKGNVK